MAEGRGEPAAALGLGSSARPRQQGMGEMGWDELGEPPSSQHHPHLHQATLGSRYLSFHLLPLDPSLGPWGEEGWAQRRNGTGSALGSSCSQNN